jgi:putative transposase
MYEQDLSPVQVAYRLRVSTKPAYQRRRRWRPGGEAALASKGPGGAVCRLDQAQLTRLRAALEGGPAAWGLAGRPEMDAGPGRNADRPVVPRALHAPRRLVFAARPGYAPQVPIHRAAERDEHAIAVWKTTTWVKIRG